MRAKVLLKVKIYKKKLFSQNMKMVDEVVKSLVLSYGPVSFSFKLIKSIVPNVFLKKYKYLFSRKSPNLN